MNDDWPVFHEMLLRPLYLFKSLLEKEETWLYNNNTVTEKQMHCGIISSYVGCGFPHCFSLNQEVVATSLSLISE